MLQVARGRLSKKIRTRRLSFRLLFLVIVILALPVIMWLGFHAKMGKEGSASAVAPQASVVGRSQGLDAKEVDILHAPNQAAKNSQGKDGEGGGRVQERELGGEEAAVDDEHEYHKDKKTSEKGREREGIHPVKEVQRRRHREKGGMEGNGRKAAADKSERDPQKPHELNRQGNATGKVHNGKHEKVLVGDESDSVLGAPQEFRKAGGKIHAGRRGKEGVKRRRDPPGGNIPSPIAAKPGYKPPDQGVWPFYRIDTDNGAGGGKWPWPGVGWKRNLSVDDEDFKSIKFYLYDEGPFDMRDADACFRRVRKIAPPDAPNAMDVVDSGLRVNEREYLTELFLLPALRMHPMRTHKKEEATVFVIGYANALARLADPCSTDAYGKTGEEWDNKVADLLLADEFFKKNKGQDFILLNSRFKTDMTQKLKQALDSGPMIATFDRFSGRLHGYWRNAWNRGSVIVMPYVSSVALDLRHSPPQEKDVKRNYYFRGNMHRWHGDRGYLRDLGKILVGADFGDVSFVTAGKPANFEPVLQQTAAEMRTANMCPSPEGDTPTSLRLFEALVAGCVPIVVGMANQTSFTLPFPSLIDYDSIAFFTRTFGQIVGDRPDGIQKFASVLESFAGLGASKEHREKLEGMRQEGMRVYDKHFSFFRNPEGVATSMLFEAWILLQKHGIISGPHT